MLSNSDQIQVAAYHIWLRRGQIHGRDRQDWLDAERKLAFQLNFATVVEYVLDATPRIVLGDRPIQQCRFCERASDRVDFSGPRPVVAGLPGTPALFSAEVCDECHADSLEPLADEFRNFWKAVQTIMADRTPPGRRVFSVPTFKALVAGAMLILPHREMPNFTDTLEWVINPDHDFDGGLFAGTSCHAYDASSPRQRPWISLARRIDDHAPLPYMICLVVRDGIAVQFPLPLCLRDQDLDGRSVEMPRIRAVAGGGAGTGESRGVVLNLSYSSRPARHGGAHRPIPC